MMTFVERTDRSFLVATPGQHGLHHMVHAPFLMARANTPIARALGMKPAPRVVPAAFDTELEGARPVDFVYRNLENTSIDIVGGPQDAVTNHASQMAHLHKIAPGSAERSYGIHVARLAGVPEPVLKRAEQVLNTLEKQHELPVAAAPQANGASREAKNSAVLPPEAPRRKPKLKPQVSGPSLFGDGDDVPFEA